MTLSEELTWRGFIKDKTFNDVSWLDEPKAFYLGVDCSADSMTVGNLAVCMLAKHLAKAGWKTILLAGGATSLIGDPGGKDEERPLKSREEITANVAGIKKQLSKLFEGNTFELVDNYDWFKDVHYLDFLREVGKHYSMTELIQRDFIATRLGEDKEGISYAEFSYSLIQGYDYWHLYNAYGVVLQIGGSDQWGNMLSGVPLIRKKEGKEVQAMSMPLVINKSTGKKFGKSEGGAVWLDASKTTPEEFYQFWINVDDDGVGDYLKIFTELDKAAISKLMAEFEQDRAARTAQKQLAYEVTKLVHGTEAATKAREYAEKLSVMGASSPGPSQSPALEVEVGGSIVDALVETALASSKTEARQLLASGGVYINDQQISKDQFEDTYFIDNVLRLRKGKTLQNTRWLRKK